MRDDKRQTGKTFRAVMEALLEASRGKTVIFVSTMNWDAMNKALATLAACSVNNSFSHSTNRLHVGDGEIIFTEMERCDVDTRGIVINKIIVDVDTSYDLNPLLNMITRVKNV